MSGSIFKGITPGIIIVNILIVTAVWISPFLNPPDVAICCEGKPMPLYALLERFADNPRAEVLAGFSILFLMSFMLVNLNTSLFFIPERTILPSIIYALSTGLFVSCQTLNPVLPASVFLMLALRSVMKAYRKEGTAFCFFDASLLIGTGALFYANIIWYGILLLIGVIILRGYKLKEILLSVTGLFSPLIFTAGVYYVFSMEPENLFRDFGFNLFGSEKQFEYSPFQIAILGFWGITVLAGLLTVAPAMNKMKVRSGKVFVLLIWWLFISLGIWIFSPGVSVEIVFLAAIPPAYLISYLLVLSRSKAVRVLIFGGTTATVALIQIIQYL